MANRRPLVIENGNLEQLQSGDVLVDSSDVEYPTAASAFTTDNLVLRSDGTGRGIQNSTWSLADSGELIISISTDLSSGGTKVVDIKDDQGDSTFSIFVTRQASQNVFIGKDSGQAVTSGSDNLCVGFAAGDAITSGGDNVCIGTAAGSAITSGIENFCLGSSSGTSITTGIRNVLIGYSSGPSITTNSGNVILGYSTYTSGTGFNNVLVGYRAGASLTTGGNNVCIGLNSGLNASQTVNVSSCVMIGPSTFTTGSGAIAIGNGVSAAANEIVIGNSSNSGTYIRGILETTSEPSAADQLWDDVGVARVSDGNTRTRYFEQYGAGTAYTLTATPAAVAFGTTNPTITLTTAGTYRVNGFVVIDYNGATFAANQAVTLSLRRTNNTPANLTNGTTVYTLEIVSTATRTAATIYWEAAAYTTANTDDALTIFADVAATPSAGSVDITEAAIKAEMILN